MAPNYLGHSTLSFKPTFHIIIIGAGLTSLATAILLRKANYKVTVLEADATLREIGAGIQIPANGSIVLLELGALDKVVASAVVPPAIVLHEYRTGSVLSTLELEPYVRNTYGVPHLVMHRADLRRILFEEAEHQGAHIRLESMISFKNSELENGVVRLEDGEVASANLIIGADGANSLCREALLQRPSAQRVPSRLVSRIVINAETMRKNSQSTDLVLTPNINTWLGPECLAVCYVLRGAYNIVLTRPADGEEVFFGPRHVDLADVRAFFARWEPRITALLESASGCQEWMISDPEELQSWVHPHGRLVLIGDAAHEITPYLAQGAAVGFESASVLSNLLANAHQSIAISGLLNIYNQTRWLRTSHILRASKKMGRIWHMPNGALQIERDRQLLEEIPSAGYPNMLADPFFQVWLWGFNAKESAKNACDCAAGRDELEGSSQGSFSNVTVEAFARMMSQI